MNSLKKIISLTFLISFFSKCSSVEVSKEAPDKNQFLKNSAFKIILQDNHSEGYSWQLNQTFDTRVLSYQNAVWHGNEKGIYFQFKTLAAGQTTLTFVRRKYLDTMNVKTFVIVVLGE